jgi:hypothetical protein
MNILPRIAILCISFQTTFINIVIIAFVIYQKKRREIQL